VFDAYGTLFDVFSVTSLCEQMFPGKGLALATTWRAKQLQYTLLRSMMDRYEDFWQITRAGLVYAANALGLDLDLDNLIRAETRGTEPLYYFDGAPYTFADAKARAGGSVQVAIEANADRAQIAVSDTGPGIPETERERIFERFVRLEANASHGGGGLGLPIARWVAQLHRGTLALESTGPAGSRFVAVLPLR